MGYDVLFETWTHPYHTLTTFERLPGGLFELPRVVVHKADGSQVAIMVGKMDEAASEAFLATVQTLITQRVNGEPLPVEPAPAAAADAEDHAARLAALADLHAAGALTDEEYARARDRLDQG